MVIIIIIYYYYNTVNRIKTWIEKASMVQEITKEAMILFSYNS
jgi:hypothetical protein